MSYIKTDIADNFNRYKWKKKIVITAKSTESRQRLNFTHAFCGIREISGPGTDVIIKAWLSEEEYVMNCLRNPAKHLRPIGPPPKGQ